MVWTIKFDKRVAKDLCRFGEPAQKHILNFLRELAKKNEPRLLGRSLDRKVSELWRYRSANYRIICQIQDDNNEIFVTSITAIKRNVASKKVEVLVTK